MARTPEQVRERGNRRLEAITYAANRIKTKIKTRPEHPNAPAWKKRLKEYEQSLTHLEIELRTGREFPVSGVPTPDGVTVGVPSADLKLAFTAVKED